MNFRAELVRTCSVALAALFLADSAFVPSGTGASPAYARAGASATFSAFGGFVPFFGGVYGNVSFTVTNVFQNGTMDIRVRGNVSQSGEGPPVVLNEVYADSISSPRQFPAVPPGNLTRSRITFESQALTLIGTELVSVPAGSFNTTRFTGSSSNGTVSYFWFDKVSGLVVQVERGGGVLQLLSSNIATPVRSGSSEGSLLILFLSLGALWVGGAALFIFVIKRAEKGKVDTDESDH